MRASGFGFVAPLLVVMVVAFNLPIAYMLGLAFWEKGRGFTLEHYEGLAEAPVYLRVLGNTMRISLIATLANVAIGYPLALWMARMQSRLGHALALMAVIAPLLTGIVVRTFAWMTILQDKGVINTTLVSLGLIEKPLPLMYNEFGTVVALVHIYVPFMVLTLIGVIGRIDERLEQAARAHEILEARQSPGGIVLVP